MSGVNRTLLVVLTGALVAVTYLVFEGAVARAIDAVWLSALDTETNRLLVVPLTLGLGVLYFAAVHRFDRSTREGTLPTRLLVVLGLGFLSLFAGAPLGPEAILIPSAILVGTMVARLSGGGKDADLFSVAGFVALFVAFFNSVLAGALGLYLALKAKPYKLDVPAYLLLGLSAVTAYLVLGAFSHKGSFAFPEAHATATLLTLLLSACFFVLGAVAQRLLALAIQYTRAVRQRLPRGWLIAALVASSGLTLLFLLGGQLVQFTGNESIGPVFADAERIGALGLAWIIIVKIVAIAWSVEMGYRGGLIFPLAFVGSAVAAIATLYTTDFNIVLAIIIFIIGALAADRKANVITSHTAQ